MSSMEQDTNSVADWLAQGCQLCADERYQEAIAVFDSALRLTPTDSQLWNYRGNAFSGMHQPATALTCYDKAIALDSTYHQAWFNRGLLLAEMGALSAALAAYDHAIALYPDPRYLHARDTIWLKRKLVV